MIESLKRPATGSEATGSELADSLGKDTPELPAAADLSTASGPFSTSSLAWLSTENAALCGVMILTAYVALRSAIAAVLTPFWYDEICTFAMAHQPTVSALWTALGHAADGNPPGFYLIERMTSRLIPNQELAFRVPSILGFCCVLMCLFTFIRKRSGGTCAFLCATTLLLTPLFDASGLYDGIINSYVNEARPYSLVAACVSIALICYQRAPKARWMLLMGISLALSQTLHYYAIFALVPFGAAEAALFLQTRRVRWSVWLALICGVLPLAALWPLLSRFRQFMGPHFWSQPSLLGAFKSYGRFLNLSPALGFGVLVVASISVLAALASSARGRMRSRSTERTPLHEHVLVLTLLALPFVAFVATRLSHGGMNTRYVLSSVLAIPVALGFSFARMGRPTLAVAAAFILGSVTFQEVSFWRSLPAKLVSPASSVEKLVSSIGPSDLPVVIASTILYPPMVHYSSPEFKQRLVVLPDQQRAFANTGSDSNESQLHVLQSYVPFQLFEFPDFVAQYPVFYLYAHPSDWWPSDLLREGYSLRLVAGDQAGKVYLVDTKKVD